jgi:hypothetical protein
MVNQIPLFRFRIEKQPDSTSNIQVDEVPQNNEDEDKSWIICRQCHQVITNISERLVVDGSHQHTFVNPLGILYEIGCFRSTRGCIHVGPASPEYSWFKGFSWKVAVCRYCGIHLGWRYVARGNANPFSGLILNRLAEWN